MKAGSGYCMATVLSLEGMNPKYVFVECVRKSSVNENMLYMSLLLLFIAQTARARVVRGWEPLLHWKIQVQIPTVPFISCVTVVKLVNLSVLQFLH